MGLDLTLAGFVAIGAIRGWFRGFLIQAIRLVGLVACVYEADPVRDLVKPHVRAYLPGIAPDLLDRLLWWAACIASYVVTVGLATWAVRAFRRQPYGEPDLYRGDKAAGFLLGAGKALIVGAFLLAALDHYALGYVKNVDWLAEQVSTSRALAWSQAYRPAARLWEAPPVRTFVAHVRQMGLQPAGDQAGAIPEKATVQAEGQPRAMALPPAPPSDDIDAAIDALKQELRSQRRDNSR